MAEDVTKSTPASVYGWVVALYKDVGLTSLLTGFICYLLVVQMPEMRSDFRSQTEKLVEAVSNNSKVIGDNNRVMFELSNEIRQSRQDRRKE